MSAITTKAPSSSNLIVSSFPIPEAPPVITTPFPCTFIFYIKGGRRMENEDNANNPYLVFGDLLSPQNEVKLKKDCPTLLYEFIMCSNKHENLYFPNNCNKARYEAEKCLPQTASMINHRTNSLF